MLSYRLFAVAAACFQCVIGRSNAEPSVANLRDITAIFSFDCSDSRIMAEKRVSIDCFNEKADAKLYYFENGISVLLGENKLYDCSSNFSEEMVFADHICFNPIAKSYFDGGAGTTIPKELQTARFGVQPDGSQTIGNSTDASENQRSLSDYMAATYGADYIFQSSSTLNVPFYKQIETSVYETTSGSYESNCTLNSAYVAFDYLALQHPTIFPDSMLTSEAYYPQYREFDTYMHYAATPTLYTIHDGISAPVRTFHKVYGELRAASIAMNSSALYPGYGGFTIWEASQIAERLAEYHSISNFNSWEELDYNGYVGTDSFVNNFSSNKRRPIILSTSAGTYGSHMMCVNGYRFYMKQTQILFWTYEDWKCILAIADGWSSQQRYLDISAYYQQLGALGSFIIYEY